MSESLHKHERWASHLVCSATGERAPLDEPAFLSPSGKPWLVSYDLDADKGRRMRRVLAEREWTLWRYRELLPLADPGSRIDLGEGGTALLPVRRSGPPGVELWIKQESQNPTGSFKDRGLSLAVNRARELGAPGVQLPSAGNAAIALSAFAAAAGLPARVALPTATPKMVELRCRAYGADVIRAGETLVQSGETLAGYDDGYWMLATLKEPYRVEGKKTMGLELAEQLGWRLPDWIVYPTGGGTGIVGMAKAFDELQQLGLLGAERARFCVVQTSGCAPIVRAFEGGEDHATPWEKPQSRVWGLRVPQAVGDFLILRAVRETGGTAVAVDESELEDVTARMWSREGLVVGPEGAAALRAVELLYESGQLEAGQEVVVFQTGHPDNYLDEF